MLGELSHLSWHEARLLFYILILHHISFCSVTRTDDGTEIQSVLLGSCKIGTGSVYSWVAFGCFFFAGCWLCFSPKHDPLCKKSDGDGAAAAAEEKPNAEEDKPEQAQDEENVAAAQSPTEEDKPQAQVY